jgi:hypothetical protein
MQPFRYQPEKIAVETLYRYEKSNIDGSRAHDIALYVAAPDQIEALKWLAGEGAATLVTATIDWTTFSEAESKSWLLDRQGARNLVATFKQLAGTNKLGSTLNLGGKQYEQTLTIGHYPWHSYDADLASLNFTFRHLVDPAQPFTIGIVDPNWDFAAPALLDKGTVEVLYLADERRGGIDCRKYRIDGAGLEQRGGFLWVSQAGEHFVDYEIALPDEPGFDSGKLRLKGVQTLSAAAWQAFINAQLNEALSPRGANNDA